MAVGGGYEAFGGGKGDEIKVGFWGLGFVWFEGLKNLWISNGPVPVPVPETVPPGWFGLPGEEAINDSDNSEWFD